jgi:DNA-binding transcriptional LysR family regulator
MPPPEPHLLQTFLALSRTLHFGRAARELHLTQSTVSHRLRKLEDEVGVALFDRTRRSVALTAAGRALLPRAQVAMAELSRGVTEARQIASGVRGRLVVSHSGSASASGLLEALSRHVNEAPGIVFEVRQASVARQRRGVLRGEIDLGCTFLELPARSDGFVTRALPERDLVAWVGSSHPLAGRRWSSIDEICQERWVVLSGAAEEGFASFVVNHGHGSRAPARPIEVDSLDAGFDLVRRGCGVTLMPGAPLPVKGVCAVAIRPKIVIRSHVFWSERADNPVLPRYLALLGVSPA